MNKYQTNNKRGGVSPSLRPPSPSPFRGQVPVRPNLRPNNGISANNDIDRELLSQSADFDGPDIEIQSILSTKDQSIIHDLVLAQKQDRYLSSVLIDSNTNDDEQEEGENIQNDVEAIIGDGTSDKTDLTSFSGYMQTSIIDNKDFDIDSKAEEMTDILDAMSDQSLGFILESITKEMEKRKITASAILNGVSTAARAGIEGNINHKTGRRPSFENNERKASPSFNKKTNVKTTVNGKPATNSGVFTSVKKATSTNAYSISKNFVQKLPNKSKTVIGIGKRPTPIKGTGTNVKDLQEESREYDFDEELRQINISPTLRSSLDGLPSTDKSKNQQKVNNRHGAAHPNEKMFTTGLRYNPSPPTTSQKKRDFPSVITEALNFFSGKKIRGKREKECDDEDFIVVEAIKAKNARRVDNIMGMVMSDDESSNGLSSFSISKSTAFDDRSIGSHSSKR